jgi:hypothetical protein
MDGLLSTKKGESSFILALLCFWTSVLYSSKHLVALLPPPKLRLPLRDSTRGGDEWRLPLPRLNISPLPISTELLIYAFGQCTVDMMLRSWKALFEENDGDALAFGKVTLKSQYQWKNATTAIFQRSSHANHRHLYWLHRRWSRHRGTTRPRSTATLAPGSPLIYSIWHGSQQHQHIEMQELTSGKPSYKLPLPTIVTLRPPSTQLHYTKHTSLVIAVHALETIMRRTFHRSSAYNRTDVLLSVSSSMTVCHTT